jgi:hypothetical protein
MVQVADLEELRREIKAIAESLWSLRGPDVAGEAMANITLAYRHLEDASMRLGKGIQVLDGGISVYDKTQVPTAAE